MDIVFNSIGFLGVSLLLGAYFLQQNGTITGHSPTYLWMNLAATVALGISLVWFWNLPAFLTQCAWALITIHSLIKVRARAA